MLDVLLSA